MTNDLMAGEEHNLATVTLYLWRRKFNKAHHS
jgi:hypothetical protein